MGVKLYLMPIDRARHTRSPRYMKSRFNTGTLGGPWTMMDFGDSSEVCIVASHHEIVKPDVVPLDSWSPVNRDRILSFLKSDGIETKWISRADDIPNGVHRIAGTAQAMQAGRDDAWKWLGRNIGFGSCYLEPVDRHAYWKEQSEKIKRKIPELRVRDISGQRRPGWRDIANILLRDPASVLWMALPATDTFTTPSGTFSTLAAYSSNWYNIASSIGKHTSGYCYPNGASAEQGAYWQADSFDAAHYAQMTVSGTSEYLGVAVRGQPSKYYGWYPSFANDQYYMGRVTTGVWTDINVQSTSAAATFLLRFEVSGSSLTAKWDGNTLSGSPFTDSTHSNGGAGVGGYGQQTTAIQGDNWEGGNLSGATGPYPLPSRGLFQRTQTRM